MAVQKLGTSERAWTAQSTEIGDGLGRCCALAHLDVRVLDAG